MTLQEIASLAEVVAAGGVIASLLLVAWEIRKNTTQTKKATWGSLVDRFNAIYAQTDDIELANLVAKGRKSFKDLTDGEKIAFGHYLEQLCIALEGVLIFAQDEWHGDVEMTGLFEKHIGFHLGFPGSKEWWEQFQVERGFPKHITDAINRALV